MTDSTYPRGKPGRPKKVYVQALRRKLLTKVDDYLSNTPLDQLSASMLKAAAEVLTEIAPAFEKEAGAAQVRATPLALPFTVDGDPAPSGAMTAVPFPSVPIPSIKSSGGIKPPPPPTHGLAGRE